MVNNLDFCSKLALFHENLGIAGLSNIAVHFYRQQIPHSSYTNSRVGSGGTPKNHGSPPAHLAKSYNRCLDTSWLAASRHGIFRHQSSDVSDVNAELFSPTKARRRQDITTPYWADDTWCQNFTCIHVAQRHSLTDFMWLLSTSGPQGTRSACIQKLSTLALILWLYPVQLKSSLDS